MRDKKDPNRAGARPLAPPKCINSSLSATFVVSSLPQILQRRKQPHTPDTLPLPFFFPSKENLVPTRKFLEYAYSSVSDPPQIKAPHIS